MTHEFEDDGMRHSGLVPTKAELEQERHELAAAAELRRLRADLLACQSARDQYIDRLNMTMEELLACQERLRSAEEDARRYQMILKIAAVDDLACLVGNADVNTPEQFTAAIDAALDREGKG